MLMVTKIPVLLFNALQAACAVPVVHPVIVPNPAIVISAGWLGSPRQYLRVTPVAGLVLPELMAVAWKVPAALVMVP